MFPYRYHSQDLERLNSQYDEKEHLLYLPLKKITRDSSFLKSLLWVHPTRESLDYALLLLSENTFLDRARLILKKIVSLQKNDLDSDIFGGWPKFLESEFIFKLSGRRWKFDRNWTEFIGLALLEILLNDALLSSLDVSLKNEIKTSILHAAKAIAKRNISFHYTNICVAGICITLLAGKAFDQEELFQHGKRSLGLIYANAMRCNCFAEYNSPTYSLTTLKALFYLKSLLSQNISRERTIVRQVDGLYELAWQEIAYHFHPTSGQWSGPHSRSYSSLLESETIEFLRKTGVGSTYTPLETKLLSGVVKRLEIIPELRPLSSSIKEERRINRTLAYKNPPQVLTTYMTPSYTIGTVNYSDLWHQRNSLIAYWGTPANAAYCRLRCLHNGKDFAAATLFSTQSKNHVLGAINFATDVNKENPYLPISSNNSSRLFTYDFRVRFEFGCQLGSPVFNWIENSNSLLTFEINSKVFRLHFPYLRFGKREPKILLSNSNKTLNVDIVLCRQRPKFIEFKKDSAMVSFSFQIADQPQDLLQVFPDVQEVESIVTISEKDLSLSVSRRPHSIVELKKAFSSGH